MHKLELINWISWTVPFLFIAAGFYGINLFTKSRIPGLICAGFIGGVVIFSGFAWSGI